MQAKQNQLNNDSTNRQYQYMNNTYKKSQSQEYTSKQGLTSPTSKTISTVSYQNYMHEDNNQAKISQGNILKPKEKEQRTRKPYFQLNNKQSTYSRQASIKEGTLTLSESQSFKEIKWSIFPLQINQWIIDTVDRNRTYSCQYIHFLIPYLLLILQVMIIHKDHAYLEKIYVFVLRKINQPDLQRQLKRANPHRYVSFFLGARKADKIQVSRMLRIFMIEEKEYTMSVCPYYYNLFAMVCNKEIVFGRSTQSLLPYTVQYETKRYNSYDRSDIRKELVLMQKALVKKYHSPDIC